MQTFLQFALLGCGAAAAYAMLAQGIVLIYRASGVINFAQGAFAMVGAYIFYELHTQAGWSTATAFVVGVLGVSMLGLISFLGVLWPLRRAPAVTRVIATLGI